MDMSTDVLGSYFQQFDIESRDILPGMRIRIQSDPLIFGLPDPDLNCNNGYIKLFLTKPDLGEKDSDPVPCISRVIRNASSPTGFKNFYKIYRVDLQFGPRFQGILN